MSEEKNRTSTIAGSPRHYLGTVDMPMSPAKKYPPVSGNDEYTSLLIHSDDSNNSTTFVDSSQYNHGIILNGSSIYHSTSRHKFGQSSIYSNDVGGEYLRIEDHSSLNFGTEDFTMDCWVYHLDTTGYDSLFNKCHPGDLSLRAFSWEINENKLLFMWDWQTNSPYPQTLTSNNIVPANTWTHIAIVRNNGTIMQFINGIKDSNTAYSNYNLTTTYYLQIFTDNGLRGYYGWVDEIRFSKGIARWTEDFTPPDQPYS